MILAVATTVAMIAKTRIHLIPYIFMALAPKLRRSKVFYLVESHLIHSHCCPCGP
jgi:hypothetical protein